MESLGPEVIYDEARWRNLAAKRGRATPVLRALMGAGLEAYVFGSVARGDVRPGSDIDVIILDPAPPYLVELAIERAGLRAYSKQIVQATPSYVPKAYIYLDPDEELVVSFPLAMMRPREQEFYRWGGLLDAKGVLEGRRVPGVNKELIAIIPTPRGHVEVPVAGHEGEVARLLRVSMDIVRERLSVLGRRREVGRTGTFIKEEVPPDEPIEEAVRRLAERNEFFRRAVTA
ncbi:MAG: putative nucleotidyltransferase [uncultured Acidilobus sp. CIS]|nr:MAG: putative nucleotidyltransferase [uncultured Acidilobus sp. CIS]